MASDITLAVDGTGRRMTFRELADVRGISAASAERLVRRRRWPRQVGNDGVVRVIVPLTEARNRKDRPTSDKPPDVRTSPRTSPLISADVTPVIRTLESALDSLREQLTLANRRIDELTEERRREAEERRRLIMLLTDRRPWWQRWVR